MGLSSGGVSCGVVSSKVVGVRDLLGNFNFGEIIKKQPRVTLIGIVYDCSGSKHAPFLLFHELSCLGKVGCVNCCG